MSNKNVKKALRLLRHPRAAVVVHDLVMVMVASLATGWIVHEFARVGIARSDRTVAAQSDDADRGSLEQCRQVVTGLWTCG